MCHENARARESSHCFEVADERGFSTFDDLIEDQGEVAVMIEGLEEESIKITGYSLPRNLRVFEEGEIRNAFLAQLMMDPKFEDQDREVLTRFLGERTWLSKESKSCKRENICVEENGLRSVYKYKPVALKVKPVIQKLPAEFRIKREIIGDPLAEMPKLSTNPPEFAEMGRYTKERKDKMDKVHGGEFLLSEERKLMHHFMTLQSYGFAWDDTERGKFREDFFPPIDISVILHKPWVLKRIFLFHQGCTLKFAGLLK